MGLGLMGNRAGLRAVPHGIVRAWGTSSAMSQPVSRTWRVAAGRWGGGEKGRVEGGMRAGSPKRGWLGGSQGAAVLLWGWKRGMGVLKGP